MYGQITFKIVLICNEVPFLLAVSHPCPGSNHIRDI